MSQMELTPVGSPLQPKQCTECGATFYRNPKYSHQQWAEAKCCSRDCGSRRSRGRKGETRLCKTCGDEFYVSPSRLSYVGGGTFCSRECRSAKARVRRSCVECGKAFSQYATRVAQGGGKFCSNACRFAHARISGMCERDECEQPAFSNVRGSLLCQMHTSRDTAARLYYGLTLDEAETLRASGCAICGTHPDDEDYRHQRGLHIDHDHKTGAVRAALCSDCNSGLGRFRDDPVRLRAAAVYLEAHR